MRRFLLAGELLPRIGRVAMLVALAAASNLAPPARALDYYVDPVMGADDLLRDGLAPGTAWASLTWAADHADPVGFHVIHVSTGVLSAVTGEIFPIYLPSNISIDGAGRESTLLLDKRDGAGVSLAWRVLAPSVLGDTQFIRNLTIERRSSSGLPVGHVLSIQSVNTQARPALTGLGIHGGETGLELDGVSGSTGSAASMSPVITNCVITGNAFGVQAFAYTGYGGASTTDPTFTNTIVSGNLGDGIILVTEASPALRGGRLNAATCTPVITHCTIANNIGSGILLDSYNGGYRAGPIRPSVNYSVITGNSDFALFEFESNTDPLSFKNNLVGGNLLGFYLDENVTYVATIAQLNSLPGFASNIEGTPAFVRGFGDDYHLRADSAGVDAAPASALGIDIDSELRPTDTDGDSNAVRDIGADEVPHCAVTAVLAPSTPADHCGMEGAVTFDASGSTSLPGFTCSQPLLFEWFENGAPAGTGPTYTIVPIRTATYAVTVSCLDFAQCRDTAMATITVHDVPTADSGPTYQACLEWDLAETRIDLHGTASAPPGESIRSTRWTSTDGVVLGATLLDAQLAVTNTGGNQVIYVTLTVTDTNDCTASSTTPVLVWRGPHPDAVGPQVFCQDPLAPSTWMHLAATVDLPGGSTVVSHAWTTSVGRFDDATLASPRLELTNLPFARTATVSVIVTDDHGCSGVSAPVDVRLTPSPTARPGGPYQRDEGAGPTSFPLDGTSSVGQAPLAFAWNTDLGSFQDTGTAASSVASPVLDIVNTGLDQLASVTLRVTDASACTHSQAAAVSVLTRPPQPPRDIGEPFLVAKTPAGARLTWNNSPIDATHDLAVRYDCWESLQQRPIMGTWARRAGLGNIAPGAAGFTSVTDPGLLDLASADLVFLKIVAGNSAGFACPVPAVMLPDCP